MELKGAAKAPTVGLLRLNILRVTKTMFLPLKGAKSTPALLIWESPRDIYGLLAKCEVKMAGYWPSSFFCEFMDLDSVLVHKLTKKDRGQYPAILTVQAWSIKDLLYGFWGNFFAGRSG